MFETWNENKNIYKSFRIYYERLARKLLAWQCCLVAVTMVENIYGEDDQQQFCIIATAMCNSLPKHERSYDNNSSFGTAQCLQIWAIQVGCNMIPITDKSDNNKLILKHLEIKSVVLSEQTDMELTTSQVTWWHVWSLTVSCRSCSCPAAWWPPSWRCWPCGTSSPPTSSHPATSSQQICGGNFLSFNFRIFLYRHKMIAESSNPNYGEECLENWLKWRLYLSSSADQRLTVYPNTRVSLANLVRLLQETYKIR